MSRSSWPAPSSSPSTDWSAFAPPRRRASGTVWSADGHIVTTCQAIGRGDTLEVELPAGERVQAAIQGRDLTRDLALLRTSARLEPPSWSDGAELKVGQIVLTLGRPGRSVEATFGMVSALGDAWRTPFGGTIDRYIEVDGRLPLGFPGGMLIDAAGAVLGVNSRILVRGGTTLPTATVQKAVEQILEHGTVRRGHLGVTVQAVALSESARAASGRSEGLLLTSVEEGAPAARAGLLLGDVLLELAGQPLESPEALVAALSARSGETVEIRFLRAGEVKTTSVTVGERT